MIESYFFLRYKHGTKSTFAFSFKNVCVDFYYKQVHLDGLTGPVQFDEHGKRSEIELEILNLRNNSFEKVSKKEG